MCNAAVNFYPLLEITRPMGLLKYSKNREKCSFTARLKSLPRYMLVKQPFRVVYLLTHSASELSGFTCTSSLTMNEKFQYPTRLENFVSERVQVNPHNSRAMTTLTFLLFKLNTLHKEIVKLWVSRSHGVMTVAC